MMKRVLNILLLLISAWPLAYAQNQEQGQDQEQEQLLDMPTTVKSVSYIYRNDDGFNGFADTEAHATGISHGLVPGYADGRDDYAIRQRSIMPTAAIQQRHLL